MIIKSTFLQNRQEHSANGRKAAHGRQPRAVQAEEEQLQQAACCSEPADEVDVLQVRNSHFMAAVNIVPKHNSPNMI